MKKKVKILTTIFVVFWLFYVVPQTILPSIAVLMLFFYIFGKELILKFLEKSFFVVFIVPLTFLKTDFLRDSLWRESVVFLLLSFVLFYTAFEYKPKRFKKPKIVVAGILFFIYLLTIISFNGKIMFSGDEPHYLVISNSILYDFDINVSNNYTRNRIENFWKSKRRLPYHGYYGIKGKKYIYSFHFPGLSILTLPFFAFAEIVKQKTFYFFIIRIGVVFWALLSALQFFELLKNLKLNENEAVLLTILTFSLSPYLFFGTHLFPTIFIVFFLLYAVNNLFFERKNYLKASIALSIMVWLGLKATIIIGGLGIALLLIEKKELFKIKKILSFLPLLFSYGLLFYWVYSAYGTFSLFSIYNGVLTPEKKKYLYELILYKIPFTVRFDSFLNYFFDQRDGLLFYFPVFFFIFPALSSYIKKRFRIEKLGYIFIPLFLYIFNYAFNTHRGGYCPPARPLGPFVWFFAILLYVYLRSTNFEREKRIIFSLLASITLFVSTILILKPLFIYNTTTHEVTTRASQLTNYLTNSIIELPKYLPSFLKIHNWDHKANYFWVLFALILMVGSVLNIKRKTTKLFERIIVGFIISVFGIYIVFPYFSPKKFGRINVKNSITLLRTFRNMRLEDEKIVVFGEGNRFFPLFQREKYLHLEIKCASEQYVKVFYDLKLIKGFKCLVGERKKVKLKAKKYNRILRFIPVFIENRVLEAPETVDFSYILTFSK